MLGRTQKVEHGRKREVEDGRRQIKMDKYLHGWHVTKFLTNFCMFVSDIVHMYHSNSQLTG